MTVVLSGAGIVFYKPPKLNMLSPELCFVRSHVSMCYFLIFHLPYAIHYS